MREKTTGLGRRGFLKTVAAAGGLAPQGSQGQSAAKSAGVKPASESGVAAASPRRSAIQFPRPFAGRQLARIGFPLGGIGAGSISLGGRGELRDWEIFNRPDKGNSPEYAFASIWAQCGSGPPVARVLEARLMPPYEGASGLGPDNAAGLLRLEGATFIGEYPLAKIVFSDSQLPVQLTLEAFTPFIPLDAEDSGLPVAILRYRVRNPAKEKATVSIAFSVENPVGVDRSGPARRPVGENRINEYREGAGVLGLFMQAPGLPESDPLAGSLALCLLNVGTGKLTYLRGWPNAKWWASPMLFWDDFTSDGELGPEAALRKPVGALCLKREIGPGAEADFTFLLSWHFPNRTPERCGWRAPKGSEQALIGNYYCARFADAWQAAEYAAGKLPALEARTRQFVQAIRETTVPAAVKDAALSNLSTLVTQTCFRAADGRFFGFEGSNDKAGCCFGNCTHVWNYEAATQQLFPALAHSMRETAFLTSTDSAGRMDFRQMLPEGGEEPFGLAAADGQMGQIVKVYLDWRLAGDTEWLRKLWPKVRQALEFAWAPGGWDADRDGVMEGAQHNTYDVEFFGPNPQCGIWYLGALRAGEEMATAMGEAEMAGECRRLFTEGSKWIDEHLFNGEYYIQQVRGLPGDQIAKGLLSARGADDPEHPDEFQVGEGCLVDQLVGQYFAQVAGLGHLLDPSKIRQALESIYKYNYKRNLYQHEVVQRVFALNDEAALVICDYSRAKRPRIPFPYFAEVMTGFEYSAAVLMLYMGMISEGVECIENIRRRYDGERRNPWDEAECGHHYARAMAAWSALPALSGFHYHGVQKKVVAAPRIRPASFASFWSTATGWGKFSHALREGKLRFSLSLAEGILNCRSVELRRPPGAETKSSARLGSRSLVHELRRTGAAASFIFSEEITLKAGDELALIL